MNDRIAANPFNEGGGHIIKRDVPKSAILWNDQPSKLGIADPGRVLQHLVKHRLKLAGRTADDTKHF